MRRTLLAGLVLVVAAPLAVLLSDLFDLDLNSVVLLGAALGAVIALVPDRSPALRLAGFVGGFVISLLGYFFRAALMPDTTGGQAVYVALVLALCVVLAVATRERLTLWSILLGAGGFVGAYELTYAAAPPEIASTSISTATQLLLTAAVGFLAASLLPADGARVQPAARRSTRQDKDANNTDANNKLDDLMMEKAK